MTMRPFYWSLRRELWESRYLYLVPLGVAGMALFVGLVSTAVALPRRMATLPTLDAVKQQDLLGRPYGMASGMILASAFVVGVFYCLDALYGERRDRSILFWKSLSVSDLTTVLSKAAVALGLPLCVSTIVIVMQLALLLWSTFVLLLGGHNPVELWARLPLLRMTLTTVYGLIAQALWWAPLYAWLLLVSAWAKRVPILWAVLPWAVISMLEKMAFGTRHFGAFLMYRVAGTGKVAFDFSAHHVVPVITPLRFLATPGLWMGLLVAAAFLALATRLRRERDPL